MSRQVVCIDVPEDGLLTVSEKYDVINTYLDDEVLLQNDRRFQMWYKLGIEVEYKD